MGLVNGVWVDETKLKVPTKEPVFYCKRGGLTAYAFACGYVQQNLQGVKMWKEHFCYHILRTDVGGNVIRSETDNLEQARQTYIAYTQAAKKEGL
jgi:hypothetical protein